MTMAETRSRSERYRLLAEDVIRSEPSLAHIRRSEVAICYLASDAEKRSHGRVRLGDCERVPARWRWAVPFDFAITVYEPNVVRLDEERLRRLLLHELLHVGIERLEDGRERYSVVPHDVEDFRHMIEAYGLDWAEVGSDG